MSKIPLRSAVIGAGKMGALHARICNEMNDCKLVAVVDTDLSRAKNLASFYHCAAYDDFRQIFRMVDTVTIATPSVSHFEIAKEFLIRKIPVLVEKPIACSLDHGKALVELAVKNGTTLAVGHSERYNPVIQALKKYMIQPIFIDCQRIHPYSFRSTDTGVILDLMIHDIDIVLSLIKSPIQKVDAIGAGIINRDEDICYASIHFTNGCITNLTASRIALGVNRKMQIYNSNSYICIDYLKRRGIIIQSKNNAELFERIRREENTSDVDTNGMNWLNMIDIEEIEVGDHEPLRLQQDQFFKAVRDKKSRPEVTGEDGLAALECANKIRQSLKKHMLSSKID